MTRQKYRLFFPDGYWFRDEDGETEFSTSRCRVIQGLLEDYVTLERKPWPPPENPGPGALTLEEWESGDHQPKPVASNPRQPDGYQEMHGYWEVGDYLYCTKSLLEMVFVLEANLAIPAELSTRKPHPEERNGTPRDPSQEHPPQPEQPARRGG
jgi:hypothetical protein